MRLIDADALLKEDFVDRFIDSYDNTVFEVIIEDAPTVDIKIEVAREIFEEIDKITLKYLDDKEYSTGDMVYDLDKLKDKYTKEGEV